MLRIDSSNNIYLTKGDTGSIFLTITKDGIPITGGVITLNIREPNKLDETVVPPITATNNNTIIFSQSTTSELRRKKYVYDIVYTSGESRITFIGGDVHKLGFWVT